MRQNKEQLRLWTVSRMINGKSMNPSPRCMEIDLDWYGYELDTYRPIKAISIRYENKKYVAKVSDLIDAFVSSGLFKVVEHD